MFLHLRDKRMSWNAECHRRLDALVDARNSGTEAEARIHAFQRVLLSHPQAQVLLSTNLEKHKAHRQVAPIGNPAWMPGLGQYQLYAYW